MENIDKYISAHTLQKRDARDVLEEYTDELAEMHGTCIDIGCGPGTVTKELILPKLPSDSVIVGADISHAMIDRAQEMFEHEKRLSFFQLDIETDNLPADKTEKYDYALSFYCLNWCKNLRHALKNIHKLLRPGGRALMMFLSYNNGFDAYKRLQNDPRYKQYMQDVNKYIPSLQSCPNPRAVMKKTLEEVGFEVLHCSNREKTFVYENVDILREHIIAVNPFLHRIPDELKEEYINEITREIAHQKILFKSKNGKAHEYSVLDRYGLLITYFRKPNDNSILIAR